MSNHLAVATVTAALRGLLNEAVGQAVDGAGVSTLRPDELGALNAPGINICLYQVSSNTAYSNRDLPTRRSDGSLAQRPQAALDLHYILACYGNETDLEPQRVLGSAVRRLHARPQLTRRAIRDVVTNTDYLGGSDLADQVELVKFTPLELSLEELSKLWSVFFQTPYRLSVAYLASLVLIEADEEAPGEVLPVRARNIYILPFRQPVIEDIKAQADDEWSQRVITQSSTLEITGKRLRGEATRLLIGGEEIELASRDVGDTRILVDLSSLPAGRLRAGSQGVQVVHRLLMGSPPIEHRGVESDLFPIVLRPEIERRPAPGEEFEVDLDGIEVSEDRTLSGRVTVKVRPKVGSRQRVLLLLNEYKEEKPAAYSFAGKVKLPEGEGAGEADGASRQLQFAIAGVKEADYLLRIQVDGAQSPLIPDLEGRYHQPRIRIGAPNG